MDSAARTLPPAAQFVLTHRLPCAVLAVLMFTTVLWLPGLAQGIPLLGAMLPLLALGLQVLTPALFALILLGGGTGFAGHVALIASAASGLIANMSVLVGLVMLTLYAMLPIFSALALGRRDGLERSAQRLAVGLGMAVLLALGFGATSRGVPLQTFSGQVLAPFFDALTAQHVDGMDAAASTQMLGELQRMVTAIFPGVTAFSLWLTWWGNIMLARSLAMRYGFYSGDMRPLSRLRFGKTLAYGLSITLALATLASGTVQYVCGNAAILLGGIVAIQGLAVAHAWLKARSMQLMTVLMYMILLMQPAMVLPFVVMGILDMWFDYRRIDAPADGGN